jgi:hypothetical protein
MVNAIATWNKAIGEEAIIYKGQSDVARGEGLYDSLDDDFTVVYSESNWEDTTEKSLRTLGTTIWELDGSGNNSIVKGDIILNDEYYLFQDSYEEAIGEKPGGIVDAETVILHELGHLLGLRHVAIKVDANSVMSAYTEIGFGDQNRKLSDIDAAKVRELYVGRYQAKLVEAPNPNQVVEDPFEEDSTQSE